MANPAPAAVYQTMMMSSGTVGERVAWDVPVPDGQYVVRLHFAEQYLYMGVGTRRFDIQVNGELKQANFDILAEAGAPFKAVVKEYTVTVVDGNLAIDLINRSTSGWQAVISVIEIQRAVVGGDAAATVDLEVSLDNGVTWQTIATAQTMDRFGNGRFTWTPDQATADNSALIRATAHRGDGSTAASDVSDEPFLIANSGNTFYVNDASLVGDEYATAIGDNANSGKDAAHPMASLTALLRAYDLNPGDVVYVDSGSYRHYTNAVLYTQDSGVTIRGPVELGDLATINRGNANTGQFTVQFYGADDVTIEHLSITGARTGVLFTAGTDSDRNTLRTNELHNAVDYGIDINTGNDNNRVLGNLVRNNGTGLYLYSNSGNRIEDNEIRNNDGDGAYYYSTTNGTFSNNKVHDNRSRGLYTYGATALQVIGNEIYNQSSQGIFNYYGTALFEGNLLHHNATAFEGYQGGTVHANWIYANTTGVTGYDLTVDANRIYSNSVGIVDTGYSRITNNIVYANTNQGIRVQGGHTVADGDGLFNNTVLQLVGEGIRLTSSATSVVMQNNLVRVDAGYGVNVDSNSQSGLVSNYNLLHRGPAANAYIGLWNAATQADLAAWRAASSRDAQSSTGNPLLLDVDGADNILGEQGVSTGNGFDDNFELDAYSPAIDAANAYVAPARDIEGRLRSDDPAATNRGTGWDLFVAQDQGSSLFSADGAAKNFRQSDYAFEQALPFSFSFYGKTYTKMWVNVNGFVQFEGPDSAYYANANSTEALLRNVRIAPLWDNLNTGPTGKDIFTSSTATSFTVRWAAKLEGTSNDVNVSLTLFADGSVRFDYGAGNQGLTPTVGLSAGNGQSYVLSSYDGLASLASANSLLWTPTPGLVYYDIGAYEFQGNSGDQVGPRVVSVSQLPVEGGSTALAFSAIQVDFDESLNGVSARSPANYELRRAGANDQFDDGDDVIYSVNPFYSFPETSLTLNFGGILVEGDYRLTLSGTKAIFDTAGNPLNGDGDNTPGGDYVRHFTIDRSSNRAPVAQPATVSVAEGGSVVITLAGTDLDGDTLTYTLPAGAQHGTLSAIDPGTHQLTYTPTPGYNGSDAFSFRVDDGKTGTSTAQVSITVTPVNQAPVALDQTLTINEGGGGLVLLQASDSETARANLRFILVDAPQHGSVSVTGNGEWLYTPLADYNGADSFTWRAEDRGDPDGSLGNAALSNLATVSIQVSNVNDPPAIVPVVAQTVDEGSLLSVLLSATDPDGPTRLWSLVSGPAGATVNAATGEFRWTPVDGPGTATVTVRVDDGGSPNLGAQTSFDITVRNVAPVLSLIAPSNATGRGGEAYSLTYSVSDPGADTVQQLTVDWGDGNVETIAGNPGTLSHTWAGRDGDYTVSVTPVDEDGSHAPASVVVHMLFNDPPVADNRLVYVDEDSVVDIVLSGTDPEHQALSFALVSGPAHGSLSAIDALTGAVRYTPDTAFNGIDSFVFSVTDADGASDTGTVNLIVETINDLPVIAPLADRSLAEGQTLVVQAIGDDVESGSQLYWTLQAAPQGASIDPVSGEIRWTAPDGDALRGFTVRAQDPDGGLATRSFEVTVTNVAPTLVVSGPPAASTGQAYQLTLAHTDPGIDTLTDWSIDWGDGSTSGVAGDATTASHVYGQAGTFSVVAQATDEDGTYAAAPVAVTVTVDNRAPVAVDDHYTVRPARRCRSPRPACWPTTPMPTAMCCMPSRSTPWARRAWWWLSPTGTSSSRPPRASPARPASSTTCPTASAARRRARSPSMRSTPRRWPWPMPTRCARARRCRSPRPACWPTTPMPTAMRCMPSRSTPWARRAWWWLSPQGTVTIDVVNAAPVAVADAYTVRPGQTLQIAAPGLLANDTDADGDALHAVSIDAVGTQGLVVAFPRRALRVHAHRGLHRPDQLRASQPVRRLRRHGAGHGHHRCGQRRAGGRGRCLHGACRPDAADRRARPAGQRHRCRRRCAACRLDRRRGHAGLGGGFPRRALRVHAHRGLHRPDQLQVQPVRRLRRHGAGHGHHRCGQRRAGGRGRCLHGACRPDAADRRARPAGQRHRCRRRCAACRLDRRRGHAGLGGGFPRWALRVHAHRGLHRPDQLQVQPVRRLRRHGAGHGHHRCGQRRAGGRGRCLHGACRPDAADRRARPAGQRHRCRRRCAACRLDRRRGHAGLGGGFPRRALQLYASGQLRRRHQLQLHGGRWLRRLRHGHGADPCDQSGHRGAEGDQLPGHRQRFRAAFRPPGRCVAYRAVRYRHLGTRRAAHRPSRPRQRQPGVRRRRPGRPLRQDRWAARCRQLHAEPGCGRRRLRQPGRPAARRQRRRHRRRRLQPQLQRGPCRGCGAVGAGVCPRPRSGGQLRSGGRWFYCLAAGRGRCPHGDLRSGLRPAAAVRHRRIAGCHAAGWQFDERRSVTGGSRALQPDAGRRAARCCAARPGDRAGHGAAVGGLRPGRVAGAAQRGDQRRGHGRTRRRWPACGGQPGRCQRQPGAGRRRCHADPARRGAHR
ncbi:MAG: tandem-95 repeat protein [Sulfuritalea sp.]|nr:tandem-95 repeat protein [Sulfuritalea sp.]